MEVCIKNKNQNLIVKFTGKHYKQAILFAEKILFKFKEKLNRINVFPVADGDTGTNLYLTVHGIAKEIKNVSIDHFGKFSGVVANAALESAQGNSGNILAAFLYGVHEHSKKKEEVSVEELLDAFEAGTSFAYSSLKNPKEGTILTAMRCFTEQAKLEYRKLNNIHLVFERSIKKSFEILREKKKEIPALSRHNVVDAGGIGFLLILNGWKNVIKKTKGFLIKLKEKNILREKLGKFCANFHMRKKKGFSISELKRILNKYGDSVIVIEHKNFVKIHIHAKDIKKLKEILNGYGILISEKITPI